MSFVALLSRQPAVVGLGGCEEYSLVDLAASKTRGAVDVQYLELAGVVVSISTYVVLSCSMGLSIAPSPKMNLFSFVCNKQCFSGAVLSPSTDAILLPGLV